MAYVNVAEWKPEQVTEWLKGLDNIILPYIHAFLSNEVSGQQLLNLQPDDLENLGVLKLGHQELILEAVEYLQNFHYELDRENLQLLALRLSCQAHSLHNELRNQSDTQQVTTQTLADVASVIKAVKPLACWLDRPPFSDTHQLSSYGERKTQLLKLGVEVATCAQRGRFAERPSGEIRAAAAKLASLADDLIREVPDPLILQPASLELATVRKRAGDDLGFFILPSFHGVHQVGEIKFQSPAHQCGKIEEGDEIVQVNYQTVVGWQRNKVLRLLEESPTEVFLTLKKRPRHTSVYGQIYIKPYRLPSKKRAPYFRWHENLPSPRPELLTIPDFEIPLPRSRPQVASPKAQVTTVPTCQEEEVEDDAFLPEGIPAAAAVAGTSGSPLAGAIGPAPVGITVSEGDEEEEEEDVEEDGEGAAASPVSMRLYLPKPRASVQRRATVTGASPTSTRPPINIEEFWREIKKERMARGVALPTPTRKNHMELGDDPAALELEAEDEYQLRGKSASFASVPRPATCLGSAGDGEALARRRALLSGGSGLSGSPRWVQRGDLSSAAEGEKALHHRPLPLLEGIGDAKEPAHFFGGRFGVDVDKVAAEAEETAEVPATPSGKPQGERARLDKSHSTPAYDMQPEGRVNGEMKAVKNEAVKLAEISEHTSPESFVNESIKSESKPMVSVAEDVGVPERIAPEPPPRPRPELIPRVPPMTALAPPVVPSPPSVVTGAPSAVEQRPPALLVVTAAGGQAVEGSKGQQGAAVVGGGYRAMVARTMSRAKAVVPAPSPRTLRKRNVLLAKGRKVSVRDLGEVEHQGWLQYRVRGAIGLGGKVGVDGTLGGSTAQWVRAWFMLVGSSFYGFKDRESTKADRLIGLAGFTVALAPEVKSRKFAFKVYHAGKVFYFAAETEESLNEWISCLSTIGIETSQGNASSEDGSEAVYFSETDDESNGACCLTPRSNRKSISSGSSNPNLSTSGILEAKSQEVQKKFSSLKKLGSKKGATTDPVNQEPVGSSLDRKYLRFLKSSTSRNMPVPTAKFRSYRRAGRGSSMGMMGPPRDEDRDSSPPPSVFGMVWTPDAAPSERHTRSESSLGPSSHGDVEDITDLRRRRRYVPSPQVAAHAQAMSKPAVAARKGSNAPPDVIKRPCRHGSSEDPEERVRCLVGARLASQRRVSIGSPPASGSSSSDSLLGSGPGRTGGGRPSRPGTFPQPLTPSYPPSFRSPPSPPAPQASSRRREFRGGSPEKFWIDSLRGRDEKVVKDKKTAGPSPASSLKLKNAALYRPPPPPLQPKPPKREESHRMRLAFEMSLDHSRSEDPEPSTPTGTRSRFRLFSPKLSRKGGDGDKLTPSPLGSPPTTPLTPPAQKTLLGSPRLHRAIFGAPKVATCVVAAGGDGAFGFGSPREALNPHPLVWPPSPAPPVPTATIIHSVTSEDPSSRSQSQKPTMGISMIGKQRRLPPPPPVSPSMSTTCPPPSPSPSSSNPAQTMAYAPNPVMPTADPIPDYPGLEYPPVFEPGTYTLSEASFLRANRRLSGAPNRAPPSSLPQNTQGGPIGSDSGDRWDDSQGSHPLPRMRNAFQ